MSSHTARREAFVQAKIAKDPTFNNVIQLAIYPDTPLKQTGAWEAMVMREPTIIPAIIASSRDTGETKVVSKTMDEFRRRGWSTEFMAVGDGLPLLKESGYTTRWHGKPEHVIDSRLGHAVVSGFSEEDNLAAAMHLQGLRTNADHFRIEDFDGAIGKNMQDYYGTEFGLFVPKKVFVANEWAAEQNRRYFHESRIEVSGSPSIPALDVEQQEITRNDLRRKLGILLGARVGAWFGQVGEATVKALEIYIDALNEVGGTSDLLIRFHPKFIRAGDVPAVLPILERFEGNVHHVSGIDIPGIRNEKVGNVNDVIDAMSFGGNERSTTANESAARRRLMFSLDIDGFDDLYGQDKSFAVAAIDRGASPVIRRADEAAGIIRNGLFSEDDRKIYFAQMKEFESDGLGAFNIVNAVERSIFLERQKMQPLK